MNHALPLVVAILAVLLVTVVLAWAWDRSQRSRAHKHRLTRAREGEEDAETILEEAGFSVVDRQVRRRWTVRVDGEDHTVEVRADLLAEKDGRTWVVEVKTGDRAPDPLHPPTRRQLLEYGLIFATGVLLVDAEAGTLVEVEFPDMDGG